MVDFDKLTQRVKENIARKKNMRRIRFGSIDPALSDHCQRCGFSYGKHYLDDLCPDEWAKEYPHLAKYTEKG